MIYDSASWHFFPEITYLLSKISVQKLSFQLSFVTCVGSKCSDFNDFSSPLFRGVAMKFCLGGGGRIHRHPNTPPPKFSFSSDFGHYVLKMVENAKFSYVSRKNPEIS